MPSPVVAATDLTVALAEDRPGTLARAMSAIAGAGINVEGYTEVHGVFHVLTADNASARAALVGAGFDVRGEDPVLVVQLDNRPGAAAEVLLRIADAGVNLSFSYLATGNRLVVGAVDLARAREVIAA
jgi:hypothetical protein